MPADCTSLDVIRPGWQSVTVLVCNRHVADANAQAHVVGVWPQPDRVFVRLSDARGVCDVTCTAALARQCSALLPGHLVALSGLTSR